MYFRAVKCRWFDSVSYRAVKCRWFDSVVALSFADLSFSSRFVVPIYTNGAVKISVSL